MDKDTVIELGSKVLEDPLTDLIRSGAREVLQAAILAELEEVMMSFKDERTDDGRARVVRSGYHPQREILTGIR